jgi:hypothetical protein
MRINEDGDLIIKKEEVELLVSYVNKALLIPSKNTQQEEDCFDGFISALKTISGDFNESATTY